MNSVIGQGSTWTKNGNTIGGIRDSWPNAFTEPWPGF